MRKLYIAKDVDKNSLVLKALGYKEINNSPSIYKGYRRVEYEKEIDFFDRSIVAKYIPRSNIPFIYVILCLIFALLIATTYFVLVFTLKENFDRLTYFFIMMIPAFILVLGGAILSFKRYFDILHNMQCIASTTLLMKEKIDNEHK